MKEILDKIDKVLEYLRHNDYAMAYVSIKELRILLKEYEKVYEI